MPLKTMAFITERVVSGESELLQGEAVRENTPLGSHSCNATIIGDQKPYAQSDGQRKQTHPGIYPPPEAELARKQ